MNHNLFATDFERTDFADSVFAVYGRTLALATQFEMNCKCLNALLNIREIESESNENVNKLVKLIWKMKLFDQINGIVKVAKNINKLHEIFKNARLARNEIAHDLTIGIIPKINTLHDNELQVEICRISKLVKQIAEADCIVLLLLAIITKDSIPTTKIINEYVKNVVKWVLDYSSKL